MNLQQAIDGVASTQVENRTDYEKLSGNRLGEKSADMRARVEQASPRRRSGVRLSWPQAEDSRLALSRGRKEHSPTSQSRIARLFLFIPGHKDL